MWGCLKTVHAEKSDQLVQVLLNQFINAKTNPDEKIADYIVKIMSLAQHLKDMDMEQEEAVVIAKIISSLPEKYDNVRTARYAVPRKDQILDKLTDHLINEESLLNMCCREINTTNEQEVYSARGKRSNVNSKKSSGMNSGNNTKRGNCHLCKRPGHWTRDCFEKHLEKKGQCKNYSC